MKKFPIELRYGLGLLGGIVGLTAWPVTMISLYGPHHPVRFPVALCSIIVGLAGFGLGLFCAEWKPRR